MGWVSPPITVHAVFCVALRVMMTEDHNQMLHSQRDEKREKTVSLPGGSVNSFPTPPLLANSVSTSCVMSMYTSSNPPFSKTLWGPMRSFRRPRIKRDSFLYRSNEAFSRVWSAAVLKVSVSGAAVTAVEAPMVPTWTHRSSGHSLRASCTRMWRVTPRSRAG